MGGAISFLLVVAFVVAAVMAEGREAGIVEAGRLVIGAAGGAGTVPGVFFAIVVFAEGFIGVGFQAFSMLFLWY